MVRFHTLQEKIRTILYEYHVIWYITVRGTPKVSAKTTADTFFLATSVMLFIVLIAY